MIIDSKIYTKTKIKKYFIELMINKIKKNNKIKFMNEI